MKKISCIIISLIILISFCSCTDSTFLYIESGFSEKLTNLLSERYEINITDSAEFVSGYFDRAFRDPSVTIYFSIPEEDFEKLFCDNWQKDNTGYSSILDDEWKFEISDTYIYINELYTALICSEAENGIIKCAFTGRHPGKYFR